MKSQHNPPKLSRSASQYDKIFKENIEAVVPNLIARLLQIQVITSEEIPDDVQHTKERKPDVLKKITDDTGMTFILQLEFQVADEPEMVYRMADYYLMLRRKYKLPVRQFVLFVGNESPKMAVQLTDEWLTFRFSLLVFSEIGYTLFLQSDQPEEILLAILGDFQGQPAERVVQQVITRLDAVTPGDFAQKRYFQQLRVLAQLRNLQRQTDLIMDSLADYVSDEKDILFIWGQHKMQKAIATNLLKNTTLTFDEIALNADVSVELVRELATQLGQRA